jgi:hypothetical protein
MKRRFGAPWGEIEVTEIKPAFARYIGIDYSGAKKPTSSLTGLRVFLTEGRSTPREVLPLTGPRKYWTRRGLAEWLLERLSEDIPTLAGIDHSFSFPLRYFEAYRLPSDWSFFLDDFQRHWPTDGDHIRVDDIRKGSWGKGAERMGDSRWRRIAEVRARAKSVFQFDVQGQVAKSTHAGLPWLLFLRQQLAERVHFWPFDGWEIPQGRSAIVEAYPALYKHSFAQEDRTPDQHDAYAIAVWMRQADREGRLTGFLQVNLAPADYAAAQAEGWILGIV